MAKGEEKGGAEGGAEGGLEKAKGVFAAIHGAGESIRGNFNAGVDRAFQDVCEPPEPSFPRLGALRDFECEEERVGDVWLDPVTPPIPSTTPATHPAMPPSQAPR